MKKTNKAVAFSFVFASIITASLPQEIFAADKDVVGGVPSVDASRPWVVALVYKGKPENSLGQFCGGAIIGSHEILTAAHCIHDLSKDEIQVLSGTQSLKVGGSRLNVIEVIKHPEYNPKNFDNDLAILKLDKSPNGSVIKLVTAKDDSDAMQTNLEVIVAGWGDTKQTGNQNPTELFEVKVPLVSHDKCKSAYQKLGAEISENMICAGYEPGGKDACQGDSGGPLFFEDGNREYMQIGVVSWGIGCAEPSKYGVYTRISKYISWIDKYVKSKCTPKNIEDQMC